MHVVFGSHPFEPRQPDPGFQDEYEAAKSVGHTVYIVSLESLFEEQDSLRAVRWIDSPPQVEPAIFRGYMLSAPDYQKLYDALSAVNLRLVNTVEQYSHCHYLPEAYQLIRSHTPETIWFESGLTVDDVTLRAALATFGDDAVIVKDYVKSEKGYWKEACHIPRASHFQDARRVVMRFLELRGQALNKGIVLRRFVPLVRQSGPEGATHEVRVFVRNGKPMCCATHGSTDTQLPAHHEVQHLLNILPSIKSSFFTADFARTEEGDWIIIELGDAQVAGIPPSISIEEFYRVLNRDATQGSAATPSTP